MAVSDAQRRAGVDSTDPCGASVLGHGHAGAREDGVGDHAGAGVFAVSSILKRRALRIEPFVELGALRLEQSALSCGQRTSR